MATNRWLRVFLALGLMLAPACARSRVCVPAELTKTTDLVDLCAEPNAHAAVSSTVVREVEEEFRRRAVGHHPPGARPYYFLALSGGGLHGAFGVGVLRGWTASGTRPTFDVVTGVSIGSLIAPFAFVGPKYDAFLEDSLVGVKMSDFVRNRSLLAALTSDAVYSSRRLARRIEDAVTPQFLCEVAQGYAEGRRLYIATTNLDPSGLVIWDMGAIASRGTPQSLELFRKVVLASASIPGFMPPVNLPVEINGQCYTEMHVDGGVSDEAIFRAFMVADLNRAAGNPTDWAPRGSRLYIINNGKLYTDPDCVRSRAIPIFFAASRSVIYNKKRDEMHRMYLNCLMTGVYFQLTEVPREVPLESRGANVSRADQEKLFQVGLEIGLGAATGKGWQDLPPGIDPSQQVLPRSGVRFVTKPKQPTGPAEPRGDHVPCLPSPGSP